VTLISYAIWQQMLHSKHLMFLTQQWESTTLTLVSRRLCSVRSHCNGTKACQPSKFAAEILSSGLQQHVN
jgi:hypothetical protein